MKIFFSILLWFVRQHEFEFSSGTSHHNCLYHKPKGRVWLPNQMDFWKNSKQPLTPFPHFWKILLQTFFIMDMVAFMLESIGQIVSVNISKYQYIC